MPDPMKIRANQLGDATEVKVLMSHEMETGQRKDSQGKVIPAGFSQHVDVTCAGKTWPPPPGGPAAPRMPGAAAAPPAEKEGGR